jgi:hypothetical protein
MARPLTHLTHGISTRRPFHPAKTVSHRISLPCLRKRNDPLCDYVIGEIGSVSESKGYESHFEREAP